MPIAALPAAVQEGADNGNTTRSGWRTALRKELDAPYMAELDAFLAAKAEAGYRVIATPTARFAALVATPLDRVRVVILGQDPYHDEGQAHGLVWREN